MIRFWPLAALFLNTSIFAQTLPQASPVPGGIAIVPVAPIEEPAPVVHFDMRRVMLTSHQNQWMAVIGLPLSLEPGSYVIQVAHQSGKKEELPFLVQNKIYSEQHLTLSNKRMVDPTPEDEQRILREQKNIQDIFAMWTDRPLDNLELQLPVRGRISSTFGLRRFFNGAPRQPHSGIDIAGPIGTAVLAPLAGVVTEIGDYFFNGKTIFIDHGQGLISMLNHLSRVSVERGATVNAGQKIGEVGKTGRVTGPHLHWSLSLNNCRIDPMLFLPRENR